MGDRLIPFGAELLAAGVRPRRNLAMIGQGCTLSFEQAKDELRNAKEWNEIGRLIEWIAGLGDPRGSALIDPLLTSPDVNVQISAAFAIGFVPSAKSANALASVLRVIPELTEGQVDVRARRLWPPVAYTLGLLRDPRAVDALIQLLREIDYAIRGPSITGLENTHSSMYQAYASDRLSYLPRGADDVGLTQLSGFVVEDLLVQLGKFAAKRLRSAINYGGMDNQNLCYPLRRLGWVPSGPVEELFWNITDPDKSSTEHDLDLGLPAWNHNARQAVTRSLVARGSFDMNFGACIRRSVASGVIPLWEEADFAREYDGRTITALRSFLKDMTWRCDLCRIPLQAGVASSIERSVRRLES